MANEGAGTSLDVDRAVSEAVARAMSTIKRDNSQTVEAAVRRAKFDRNEIKSRGNKQQYEHEEDVLEKMEEPTSPLRSCSLIAASHTGAPMECRIHGRKAHFIS